jgi:hypothetical protein
MLFLLYGFCGLFDHLKRFGHFVPHFAKIRAEECPFGIDDDVRRNLRWKAAEPHRLAKAALHAVALNRSPQHFPDSKTDPQSSRDFAIVQGPPQIKNGHVRRKMAATLLVNPLKISMPQKTPLLWELALRLLLSGQNRALGFGFVLPDNDFGFS